MEGRGHSRLTVEAGGGVTLPQAPLRPDAPTLTEVYTGEPAPRRLPVALALSAVMPGLGHLYCGQGRRGLAIWLSILLTATTLMVAWGFWIFVPALPLLVLLGAWILLQAALWRDLARFTRRSGACYRLRPCNHWVVYFTFFVALGLAPAFSVYQAVTTHLVSTVEIQDDLMFPKLLKGDRLLVDRRAFAHAAPQLGELVVVSMDGALHVARVLATAGETIHLRDGRPVINGDALDQRELGHMRVPRIRMPGPQDALEALKPYVELRRGRGYVVTYRRDVHTRPDLHPVTLNPGELFVMGDNRDAALVSQGPTRVLASQVVGRPGPIWASFDEIGQLRDGRLGWSAEALGEPPPPPKPRLEEGPVSLPLRL